MLAERVGQSVGAASRSYTLLPKSSPSASCTKRCASRWRGPSKSQSKSLMTASGCTHLVPHKPSTAVALRRLACLGRERRLRVRRFGRSFEFFRLRMLPTSGRVSGCRTAEWYRLAHDHEARLLEMRDKALRHDLGHRFGRLRPRSLAMSCGGNTHLTCEVSRQERRPGDLGRRVGRQRSGAYPGLASRP